MRVTAGTTNLKRSILLISSGTSHPPRIRSILEGAGFHVQFSAWRALQSRKGAVGRTANSGRAAPGGKVAAGLEAGSIDQIYQDLLAHRRSVTVLLKTSIGLFPGVLLAGFAFYDSSGAACTVFQSLGARSRRLPERLAWSQYPLLRVVREKQTAVYTADLSILPQVFPLSCAECGGLLALPLPARDPLGVLFLAHNRAAALEAGGCAILIALAQALETLLENAILRNQLAISEARYRNILTAAPFLIGLLDSQGTILEVNPKTIRELRRQGIPVRKVIGLNLLKNPATPEEIRGLLAESLLKTEGVSREKISLPLPRGTEVFRVHAFPMRGRSGAGPELLVIGEMITHYQQVMDEAERTERLAAIGRVAASLAHEINNPLQALRSHLELIRSYPLSDEEREQSFGILEREVDRLDETTRRVLGFARPAPDVLQPVSLTGILEQTLALSQNYLRNQRVEIVTDFPPSLPPVQAAAGQLIQVFLNIILNGVHAMQGKGRLEIRVRSRGDRAEVSFTNDGPPIPSETLPRIFDPFFTTRAEGTGLGLSTSHAILQRHHGAIQVANLPHRKGVVFTIDLPFAAQRA